MKKGQRYRISSFDLGFINILPVDILLEVKDIRYAENALEMSPFPLPGQDRVETLMQIAKWFRDCYPARTKENCLLKNAIAFEKLIDLRVAVLQEAASLPSAPPSLLTAVQQGLPWPSLSGQPADEVRRPADEARRPTDEVRRPADG